MVGEKGLEPLRSLNDRRILSPLCLPIPPLAQQAGTQIPFNSTGKLTGQILRYGGWSCQVFFLFLNKRFINLVVYIDTKSSK